MEALEPIKIDPNTFLSKHCILPALPDVVYQLQQMIHSDSKEIGKAVELISRDPAIVAQVFKVVNSAYYGFSREIEDLKFALAYLGMAEVYRIILAFYVVDALEVKQKDELKKFWFHSYYTALCSKHLGKKLEPLLTPEKLWPAAILHDIGKLVYLKFFPDHYNALIEFKHQNGCLFSKAENELSFPPSTYLGTLLCRHWRLPGKIMDACGHHGLKDLLNIKENNAQNGFRRIICLANLIVTISSDDLQESLNAELVDMVRQNMGYTDSEFLSLMGEIYELQLEVENLAS